MEIEQRGGTFRRLLRGGRREGARDRLAAHTYLDARGLRNDGSVVLPEFRVIGSELHRGRFDWLFGIEFWAVEPKSWS